MGAPSVTAAAETPGRTVAESTQGQRPHRLSPGTILLWAIWFGLVMGFVDLALLAFKRRLFDHDLIRLGAGFPWIIPAGVAALVLLPGATLALAAWVRRGGLPLEVAMGIPSFVGFLDVSAKLPLELWSSSLLSAGLAIQTARLVGRYRRGFLRFARLTVPLFAGLVLMLALATSGSRVWSEHRAVAALPPPPPSAPNVLLIVWDTVRAQNLSLYGYGRPTTPNLERLAARGVWFRRAFATSPWTLPSHASLFTGRWPHELSAGWKTPLDDREPTLADRLASKGYVTAGFVANLDYLGRENGIARGFAHYEDYPFSAREIFTRYVGLGRNLDQLAAAMWVDKLKGGQGAAARPLTPISREHSKRASDIDRAFLSWLSRQHGRGRPFFAFLNYNDAHTPYEVPDENTQGFGLRPASWRDRRRLHDWKTLPKSGLSVRDVQLATDLYDDSIAYLDRRLGALLDELGEARRVGRHACDRHRRPRRAPRRPPAVLPRLQSVPATRPGSPGDRGSEASAHGPCNRRAGESARPTGDGSGPDRDRAVRRVPWSLTRPALGSANRGPRARVRAGAHGGGTAVLFREPGPRTRRQRTDEVTRRRGDALHPLGRRTRRTLCPGPRSGRKVQRCWPPRSPAVSQGISR